MERTSLEDRGAHAPSRIAIVRGRCSEEVALTPSMRLQGRGSRRERRLQCGTGWSRSTRRRARTSQMGVADDSAAARSGREA
jgi:hypothetical protein